MVLLTVVFRRQDQKGFMTEHCRMEKLTTSYDYERYPDDSLFEGALTYEEVR